MTLLPIFLKLAGRRCLLVGAGKVALEKIGTLLKTGLDLHVVAPQAREEIRQLALEGRLAWIERSFQDSDLDGNFLVVTATDSPQVNAQVYRGCVERNILCNSVDDVPNCDFYFGSIVSRGNLQIAISTAGESPALAQRLRREIDAQLPRNLGPWLEDLGELRREVLATHPSGEERKALLHTLAQLPICESAACPARVLARQPTPASKESRSPSAVFLVGAGPGDPELLTVKATRLIQAAEVLLHDDLVPQAILDLAPATAEVYNVGKRCGTKNITQGEINALMIDHVRAGRSVVRLKSGDPLLFGRAAEEIDALTEAGIPFQIVPGITAAFAAAAALGCSLTDRRTASSVLFSTGHHAHPESFPTEPRLEDVTRIVYMPGRDLSQLAQEWLDAGLPPEFPCAVVSRAAQPEQELFCTTIKELGGLQPTSAPSLVIAGWAVRKLAG